MVKQRVNKLQMTAAASLFALAVAITPASADHDHGFVVPLVTGFTLGALAYHSHSHYRQHRYYRYRSYGHGQYRHSQPGRGHYRHKPRQSYSQGGYHQRPGHSHNQGGYHQPRRKH